VRRLLRLLNRDVREDSGVCGGGREKNKNTMLEVVVLVVKKMILYATNEPIAWR
jgi:hypothetical protein